MADKKTTKGKETAKKENKATLHKHTARDSHKHEGHGHIHKGDSAKPAHKDVKEKQKGHKEEKKEVKEKVKTGKIAEKVDKEIMLHAYKTIIHPLITEKSIGMIESENKLVFVVNGNATKHDVRKAVEELNVVKVDSVNIMRDTKARKRAFVKINEKFRADEIATKLGVL